MSIANLPTARINCGQPFDASIAFSLAGDPVDLTGWTGRFAIATSFDGPAIVDVTPTLTDAGLILVGLTDAQTRLLQPHVGRCLVFQIDIENAPDAHRMQGRVQISPEILA